MVKRILSFAGQVLRVVIYARVSEDRRKGASCEEQVDEGRADLAELAAELGCTLEIVAVESDNDIGASEYSKGTRKGWPKVLDLMRTGRVDMLWTWEHSRGDRELDGYLAIRRACRDAGVLWRYSGDTYDMDNWRDRERTGNDAVKAESESGQTSDRVSRSTRRNAAKGRPHGRRLYGYKRVHDPDTGKLSHQEPDPSEAWVVQWIYREFLAGRSIRELERCLNTVRVIMIACGHVDRAPLRQYTAIRGTPEQMSWPWSTERVRKILRNRAYAGQRVWKGDIIEAGGWEPIIDPEVWRSVQARLDQRSWTRQTSGANLMAGLACCATCRARLNSSRNRDSPRRIYRCSGGRCVVRDAERLEEWVSLELLARFARSDVANLVADSEDPAVVAANQRIGNLKAELAEAKALWHQRDEHGVRRLSVQGYAEMEADLLPRIAAAEREARSAVLPLSVDIPSDPASLPVWWHEELSPELRREVAAAFIVEVTVSPVGRGRRHYDDADYTEIVWRR